MQLILVAVDGHTVATRAVTVAADLAAALGARLAALSVLDGDPDRGELARGAQRQLEGLGRHLGVEVTVTSVHCDERRHCDEFLSGIARLAPDLVVMPAPAPPADLGDAVADVLRSRRVPVLVVPADPPGPGAR